VLEKIKENEKRVEICVFAFTTTGTALFCILGYLLYIANIHIGNALGIPLAFFSALGFIIWAVAIPIVSPTFSFEFLGLDPWQLHTSACLIVLSMSVAMSVLEQSNFFFAISFLCIISLIMDLLIRWVEKNGRF